MTAGLSSNTRLVADAIPVMPNTAAALSVRAIVSRRLAFSDGFIGGPSFDFLEMTRLRISCGLVTSKQFLNLGGNARTPQKARAHVERALLLYGGLCGVCPQDQVSVERATRWPSSPIEKSRCDVLPTVLNNVGRHVIRMRLDGGSTTQSWPADAE